MKTRTNSEPSDIGCPVKVLVLSRNYPNGVFPLLGLWVENLVQYSANFCEAKVISPVPYCPPLLTKGSYFGRFRKIERHRVDRGIEVFHPRFFVAPGYQLHGLESISYYLAVDRLIDRLRKNFPFDLIHAHFTFPDGWVAAKLGKRYHVPVIITEQAPWRPWMDNFKLVKKQAIWAARQCTFHIAISKAVRDSIAYFTGESEKLIIIPDGVDGSLFTLPEKGAARSKNQILFVGTIRPVKGVDILIKAMQILAPRRAEVKLVIVGESFYKNYRKEYDRLRELVSQLGLDSQIEFAGRKLAPELVRYMQDSALLVLPSRMESLGMVLVEALACGTPVVATRCGGPEDIVSDEVGVLVAPDDPEALARGIERVLDSRSAYEPTKLRNHALQKFGLDFVSRRVNDLYVKALETRSQILCQESAASLCTIVPSTN